MSARPDAAARHRTHVRAYLSGLEKWCRRLADMPSTTKAQREAVLNLREMALWCRRAFLGEGKP
jgi:hypothetical protein